MVSWKSFTSVMNRIQSAKHEIQGQDQFYISIKSFLSTPYTNLTLCVHFRYFVNKS